MEQEGRASGGLSRAAARTGKEDEEKNKKQEKIWGKEELLKLEDKKMNYRIYNTIIGDTHGGKVIGRFSYWKHMCKFKEIYVCRKEIHVGINMGVYIGNL